MGEAIMASVGRSGILPGIKWKLQTRIYTSNGQFTVPSNIRNNELKVMCYGGGSSMSGCSWAGGNYNFCGGGGGWMNLKVLNNLNSFTIVNINIGKGGIYNRNNGQPIGGGTTFFGNYISANGGSGKNGGSGGGGGVIGKTMGSTHMEYPGVDGGVGYQFGGGGGGGGISNVSAYSPSDYYDTNYVMCGNGGNGGIFGGGGGCGGKLFNWSDKTFGIKNNYGGNGGANGKNGSNGNSINNNYLDNLENLKFINNNCGGIIDSVYYYGGGGGGGYGGNGGNGGKAYGHTGTIEKGSSTVGGGGGGGGYGSKGGDANCLAGGGGGGYAGNGADGTSPDFSIFNNDYRSPYSIFGGGGGGYGPSNYGAGGGGTAINGNNGKDGICIIQYYEMVIE